MFVADWGSDRTDFNSLEASLIIISSALRQLLVTIDFLGIPVSDTFEETDDILQMQIDEKFPILNWKGLF